ncbi:MAG: acetylxylan esterase [Opitutaceae bacterium]|nr:acetylxylan esterase [Opitutaceae bacterium]
MRSCLFAILASLTALARGADAAALTALLSRPILEPGTPLAEVQAFTEQRVPAMPAITSLAEWQRFAERTRREVLEKIVFRGDLARQWRDAPARVEWLDTLPGGPGYSIRKLRYEALPGLWIPALLYLPDRVSGKIPVHLAVNGHDKDGKAAPYKQLRCINLAKRGVASLNVEWFAQGQLRTEGFVHYRMNQLDLCGVSGLAPFYLAMSRGLDALLSLPYADPARVAVSGLSGGGWQTIIISALDPRVTLSNPVAGYSSYRTRARFLSDLGDSEQTPNDLATIADYTHLTALLAGRTALLTYNAKDNCCFASPHALQPLLDAAEPAFRLHGQPQRLRSHVNFDPGTHNFEVDNRQALYRIVGDTFFPGDAAFDAQEIPSQPEVKTAAQLEVPLPPGNLDFTQLALAAAQNLPRKGTAATREHLAAVVKFAPLSATATRTGTETREGVQATFWKLRLGESWTVPVTELTRSGPTAPSGTTLLVADAGRKSLAARSTELLNAGQRVLAVDPFYFGESKISQRDFLFALLVAAVGDRALGLQSSQLAAAARWAVTEFHSGSVALESTGPRLGLAALVATALEPRAIATLRQTDALPSLHEILRQNWTVDKYPELFCFGLLESFDVPQLRALAGARAR